MRMLSLFLLLLSGCGGVIRDSRTYRQELEFLGAVTARLAVAQLEQAERAAASGRPGQCVELAEPALVASVRVPWHVASALYLADLEPAPGPAPQVPTSTAWCAERVQP